MCLVMNLKAEMNKYRICFELLDESVGDDNGL